VRSAQALPGSSRQQRVRWRLYAKNAFTDVGSADFFVGPDRQCDRVLAATFG